jgi:DNA-directed RNA polymerase subunit beta
MSEMMQTRIEKILVGQKCASLLRKGQKTLLKKDKLIDSEMLKGIPVAHFEGIVLSDAEITEKVHDYLELYRNEQERVRDEFESKLLRYERGDEMPPGVIKMVKVYVAMKRKLSVGDKMAGRHGNKGVVSRILPVEDMPYFENGETVDMVLNPLGVPSRMNVGQILEIHLGYVAKGLGDQLNQLIRNNEMNLIREKMKRIFDDDATNQMLQNMDDEELRDFAQGYANGVYMATPVFDGAKEDEVKALLKEAGLSTTAQTTLHDGHTGEPFKGKITVGTMYMLKLHHLVDDKIHARSIGPYSLVTQQPLGGKAQFGGQRLGEMEVWAMEAYGAAHALQEFITVKSDDMAGRTRMYEKIVKGQNVLEPGIPESFKVLTKELQSLGLDVMLLEEDVNN